MPAKKRGGGGVSSHKATLKKMLFPVQRPGENSCADWDLFFLIYDFFPPKVLVIFLQKKRKTEKKKRICGRPSGHDLGHPLHRKQTFF